MKFSFLSMLVVFLTACGSGSSGGGANGSDDTTPPIFIEVTPVATPATDTTPSYTFHSNEAGALTYSGSCTSTATLAVEGNNTITFSTLPAGTYSNCKINVTDSADNVTIFTVSSFTITGADTTSPILATVIAIATPTNDTTPDFTFNSTEAGTITYGGSCSSAITSTVNGNNTVLFNELAVGTYTDCTVKVTDSAANQSLALAIPAFTITAIPVVDTTAPVLSIVSAVPTPGNDTTPSFTFLSSEAGYINYGGICSSATTVVNSGNNTITMNVLTAATYSNCTVNVIDAAGNTSANLSIAGFTIETTAPTLAVVIPVPASTNDTTPNFTFSSTEAGIITYGGSCSSAITTAINGNNIITLNALTVGTYNNCTVKVTDVLGNVSSDLVVTDFTIETTEPTLSQITPVSTQTYLATPSYTFHSTEAGTITYGGDCASLTTSASSGNNTITFSYLDIGTYDNCTIIVTDAAGNSSAELMVSGFDVFYGVVTTDLNAGNDEVHNVAMQADGKILVGGSSYGDTPFHLALVRYNVGGSLDASFNDDGIVTTNMGSLMAYGYSVAVQANGKILMVGANYNESGPVYVAYDITLVRFNSDGSLDASFNDDGIVTTDVNIGDVGYSVVVQSDDKILVVGESVGDLGTSLTLVRYNSNGSLDSSFSGDGILITNIGAAASSGYSATVQPDGKILVSGISHNGSDWDIFLVRYNTDGSLDVSFNNDGLVTTDLNSFIDYGYSVTLQSDGKILVAGSSGSGDEWRFALVRYNNDGSLDTNFSGDGVVITSIGTTFPSLRTIIVQSDDKILVVGTSHNASNNDIALLRYNSDGSLDASFNGDGIVTTDIGFKNNTGESVVLQPDGKIVVAGSSNNGTDWDFSVVRYNTDGSLDSTFHD